MVLTGQPAAARIRELAQTVPARFLALDEGEWRAQPLGKWTKQEILGHLIDSAVNNLQRFTRATTEPEPYVVADYPQAHLVRINGYAGRPARRVAALWSELNLQIADVVDGLDEASLARRVRIPEGDLVDLGFLVDDYVRHMEYHLRQIFGGA